jgi:hypothetical protein
MCALRSVLLVLGFVRLTLELVADLCGAQIVCSAQLQPHMNAWSAERKDQFMNFVKGVTPLPPEKNPEDEDSKATHHKAKSESDPHKSSGLASQVSMSSLSNRPSPASPAAAAAAKPNSPAAPSPNKA